jgi:hypothetical protein
MALSDIAQKVFTLMDGRVVVKADDLKSRAGLEQEPFDAALKELIAEGLLKQADPSNFKGPVGTVYLELTTLGFMT